MDAENCPPSVEFPWEAAVKTPKRAARLANALRPITNSPRFKPLSTHANSSGGAALVCGEVVKCRVDVPGCTCSQEDSDEETTLGATAQIKSGKALRRHPSYRGGGATRALQEPALDSEMVPVSELEVRVGTCTAVVGLGAAGAPVRAPAQCFWWDPEVVDGNFNAGTLRKAADGLTVIVVPSSEFSSDKECASHEPAVTPPKASPVRRDDLCQALKHWSHAAVLSAELEASRAECSRLLRRVEVLEEIRPLEKLTQGSARQAHRQTHGTESAGCEVGVQTLESPGPEERVEPSFDLPQVNELVGLLGRVLTQLRCPQLDSERLAASIYERLGQVPNFSVLFEGSPATGDSIPISLASFCCQKIPLLDGSKEKYRQSPTDELVACQQEAHALRLEKEAAEDQTMLLTTQAEQTSMTCHVDSMLKEQMLATLSAKLESLDRSRENLLERLQEAEERGLEAVRLSGIVSAQARDFDALLQRLVAVTGQKNQLELVVGQLQVQMTEEMQEKFALMEQLQVKTDLALSLQDRLDFLGRGLTNAILPLRVDCYKRTMQVLWYEMQALRNYELCASLRHLLRVQRKEPGSSNSEGFPSFPTMSSIEPSQEAAHENVQMSSVMLLASTEREAVKTTVSFSCDNSTQTDKGSSPLSSGAVTGTVKPMISLSVVAEQLAWVKSQVSTTLFEVHSAQLSFVVSHFSEIGTALTSAQHMEKQLSVKEDALSSLSGELCQLRTAQAMLQRRARVALSRQVQTVVCPTIEAGTDTSTPSYSDGVTQTSPSGADTEHQLAAIRQQLEDVSFKLRSEHVARVNLEECHRASLTEVTRSLSIAAERARCMEAEKASAQLFQLTAALEAKEQELLGLRHSQNSPSAEERLQQAIKEQIAVIISLHKRLEESEAALALAEASAEKLRLSSQEAEMKVLSLACELRQSQESAMAARASLENQLCAKTDEGAALRHQNQEFRNQKVVWYQEKTELQRQIRDLEERASCAKVGPAQPRVVDHGDCSTVAPPFRGDVSGTLPSPIPKQRSVSSEEQRVRNTVIPAGDAYAQLVSLASGKPRSRGQSAPAVSPVFASLRSENPRLSEFPEQSNATKVSSTVDSNLYGSTTTAPRISRGYQRRVSLQGSQGRNLQIHIQLQTSHSQLGPRNGSAPM